MRRERWGKRDGRDRERKKEEVRRERWGKRDGRDRERKS